MTKQEALDAHDDIVNFVANGCYNGKNSLDYSTLIIAMESIGKQIPMKPMCSGVSYDCPNCLGDVGRITKNGRTYKEHYCQCCGKAIDWSDC